MKKYEPYLQEVTKKYLSKGKPYSVKDRVFMQERLYKTAYKVHNVSNANLKKLEKETYSFSHLPEAEQLKIWSFIFKNTDVHGVGQLSINIFKSYQKKKNQPIIRFWPILKTWVTHIENWAHGDMIASLYAQMLEEDFKKINPSLILWAKAKSPWKRRMAILSQLYYAPLRNKYPPFANVVKLLKPQMGIDHYYLQKAVGWTLREMTTAYPKQAAAFMDKNLAQITSTAFSASVERVSKTRRETLKKRRKEYRKQGKL